jgi:hypothetical protein
MSRTRGTLLDSRVKYLRVPSVDPLSTISSSNRRSRLLARTDSMHMRVNTRLLHVGATMVASGLPLEARGGPSRPGSGSGRLRTARRVSSPSRVGQRLTGVRSRSPGSEALARRGTPPDGATETACTRRMPVRFLMPNRSPLSRNPIAPPPAAFGAEPLCSRSIRLQSLPPHGCVGRNPLPLVRRPLGFLPLWKTGRGLLRSEECC